MASQNEKYSFKGWKFKTWAVKNKESIKLILSGVAGLLATFLSSLSSPYAIALGGVVSLGSKLALDTLDYWQSE